MTEQLRSVTSCDLIQKECARERAIQSRWLWGTIIGIALAWLLSFGTFATEKAATNARQDADIRSNTNALVKILDKLDSIEQLLRK